MGRAEDLLEELTIKLEEVYIRFRQRENMALNAVHKAVDPPIHVVTADCKMVSAIVSAEVSKFKKLPWLPLYYRKEKK